MDKERSIGKEIIIFSNQIRRRIDKEARKYGLTSIQARILGFVFRQSAVKNVFQKDIEEEFNIRRSSVTSVIQLMEKNGYINRESVCEDARLKKIILTQKGLETEEKVHQVIIEIEESLQKTLNDEEKSIFIQLIDRLSKNMVE
ncbi:MAG: MarR family winged helix-turn-helix transcriptional regulator [Cellulosilyticaceae bacterium]